MFLLKQIEFNMIFKKNLLRMSLNSDYPPIFEKVIEDKNDNIQFNHFSLSYKLHKSIKCDETDNIEKAILNDLLIKNFELSLEDLCENFPEITI